jgi:hypothetical protein
MAIEDSIDLELVSDFSGLTPAQLKIYKKRYDDIVKIIGQIEDLKGKDKQPKIDEKIAAKRRELTARLVTNPSVYTTESAWTTAARIAERDEVHHKIPLNKYSRSTYSLAPRDIIKMHDYLEQQGVYLGNHPLNTVSLHEVTHKGSKQAKPGAQGSSLASAHPRGTKEGLPFEFDIQTPKQRAAAFVSPAATVAGPVTLAATLGGSQDVKVQQQKFEEYAETLPPQQAAEVRQRRQQSLEEQSKPLIDGNQLLGSMQNELKYIGGQVRLGRLPYGLEQAAGWIKSAF